MISDSGIIFTQKFTSLYQNVQIYIDDSPISYNDYDPEGQLLAVVAIPTDSPIDPSK